MEEEKSYCTNCLRDIPTVNFAIHTVHCSRNIILCRLCNEPVLRTEIEAHQGEFHSHKECEACGEKMDVNQLEKHKIDLCPARKVTCSICELDLPAADINEHENYCGSRTELCDECGEYVMLKYQKLHIESNHGFFKLDDEPGPKPSWQNNERGATNGFDTVSNDLRYQRKVPNSASGVGFLERNQLFMSSSPSKRTNDMPQVNSVPPPHASKSVHKTGIMGDSDKRMRNVNPEDHSSVAALFNDNLHLMRHSSNIQTTSNSQEEDLVALPCEFCEALVPANQLILHQTGCRPDLAKLDELTVPSHQSTSIPDSSIQIENLVRSSLSSHKIHNNFMALPSSSTTSRDGSSSVMDETLLPCEFCHKFFTASKLIEHQPWCPHAWSEDLFQNDRTSGANSSPIPMKSVTEIGRSVPLEPSSLMDSTGQSFHRFHNNEMASGFGGSRKLIKEDLKTNVVKHNNFPKDVKTKQTYNKGQKDVGQHSFEKEKQHPRTRKGIQWSPSPNPLLPVYNELKEDDGRLALLNKAKVFDTINSHLERNKDSSASQRNHIMKEMAVQISAHGRQPGHFNNAQSSSYGSGSYPSSSNRPQSGRSDRMTGAIPKQKAGTSKSPSAF